MAERGLTLAEAIEWLELPIDGVGGKTLGRVAGITSTPKMASCAGS
ncbi:MAG TPA: hypothetical protein VIZ61_10060 [Solirubrobacterales bacterium]